MLRVVRIATLVLLAVIVSRGLAPQSSQPSQAVPSFAEDGSSRAADLRPGMDFTENGLTLRVPPRGESVAAEAIDGKGKAVELALETQDDGSVIVHRGEQAERVAIVGGTSGACGDGAYTLAGTRWASTYKFYVSSSNLPSNLSFSGAEAAFKKAVFNIVNAYNDCGRGDAVAASATYVGKTSSSPEISDRAACQSRDGRNELGFKRLPSNYLAYSCRWWGGGYYVEGDTAYNTYYKWYSSKPSSCSWRWSITNVATHELGHTFGLSHVSESSHPKLTMSPTIYPCTNSDATLGLGDLRGLESLY
ncbi:MAG TPA: matrixin family metalloprotease [Actinomycetota bacterium]|nr:matrixin family metalloprotease [Actinomycetota bacterium]